MGVTENEKNKRNKIVLGIIISLCTVLILYFGMAIYFINHFYFGSAINCISISGNTVGEAKKQMSSKIQSYSLNLKERGGKSEQIKAADIDLKYDSGDVVKNLKGKQNPFVWIFRIFNKKNLSLTEGVSYNKQLLEESMNKLSCLDSSKTIEPKNPGFKYINNSYVIVDEESGNKVNKNVLYNHVVNTILDEETSLDLESINCYVKPEYTAKSQKVIDTRNLLNKYVSSKITYNLGEKKEIIDGSIINKWLNVDKNFQVTFDEEKAEDYLKGLLNTYNTIGKARNFVTSSGNTIRISGGDYGWQIDIDKEEKDLITVIKKGQTVTKEPEYTQTAFSHNNNDIGNTYVEIDLSRQHLWFYKNGSLVVQGDVVTGNVSSKHSTPVGIYKLKFKQRNAVLKGPDYSAPVNFWMPFNGGIGMHDASWRGAFGGNIYRTNGSHGCVNEPYNLAKTIFNNIDPGTPIICFY